MMNLLKAYITTSSDTLVGLLKAYITMSTEKAENGGFIEVL